MLKNKYIHICLSVTVGSFLVTGCASKPIGPYPDNYKQIVKESIRSSYFDPYSIQDLAISEPREGGFGFNPWWVVCVDSNAKNRMGGYTGISRTEYAIKNGNIVSVLKNGLDCGGVYTAPWTDFDLKQK